MSEICQNMYDPSVWHAKSTETSCSNILPTCILKDPRLGKCDACALYRVCVHCSEFRKHLGAISSEKCYMLMHNWCDLLFTICITLNTLFSSNLRTQTDPAGTL